MSGVTGHGLILSNVYTGTDGHNRSVHAVEYHYGNVQVRVYDSFWGKVEYLALPEWNTLNPKYKIVRP